MTTESGSSLLQQWTRQQAGHLQHSARTAARRAAATSWFLRDLRSLRSQDAWPDVPTAIEFFPQLGDRTAMTDFDAHYVYQGPWAFRHLLQNRPAHHVDVGSALFYLGFFSGVVPTTFIDLRPAGVDVEGLSEIPGSVLDLPYDDGGVSSLSCMHVIEHVGLGRYGDPVDVNGSAKACRELSRVLATGGMLYLTAPIGRPRVCFNAHRVHCVEQIVSYCEGLTLVGLDGVLDDGSWVEDCTAAWLNGSLYALGLFRFTR